MWTAEMKSNEGWSSQLWSQIMQLRKEAWKKIQDFNGVWTGDLAIPVRCSNQLSYEATDVGSWSIVGSYEINQKWVPLPIFLFLWFLYDATSFKAYHA